MRSEFYLSPSKTEVVRVSYGLLQLAIEFGGLMKILLTAMNLIVAFVGEYVYYMAMIRKLYFMKSNHP